MEQNLSVIFLIAYIIIVVVIGIKNSNSKNTSDYFLASRKLPSWLLAITFIASWWGGGSAIDLVDHSYNDGLGSFWIYGMPVLFSTLFMYFMAGKIRRANTISQPELVEKRYNKRVSRILTLFILVFMTLGVATQIIVIGHFFQSFFDMPYLSGAIVGSSIVLFYSMFGGFKGVVLTDLLQFVFFFVGGIALLVFAYNNSGGWQAVEEHASHIGKTDYTQFWSKASDYLAYVFTFGVSWAVQANVWQRISAAKTEKSAKNMMALSFIAFIPLYLMVTLTGMFASTMFSDMPTGGIVPAIVKLLDSPVLSALIFVGLCSAIMSTMDSMLNTGALSLTVDIYQKYIKKGASAKELVSVGRISTLLVFLVALVIALRIESVIDVAWIGADFIATGAFVPIIGGFFWEKSTSRAAVSSMIFGFLFSTYNMLIALGISLPSCWEVASVEQAIIGISISLILFIFVSLTPTKKTF
ncbi:MAG: sodium:solute symporter family protein [Rikenellaceae bacterium]